MDTAEAIEFLRTNHHSVLATLRGDGAPQLSPVVHAVDDEGRVLISTRRPAMKVRNLERSSRGWLCAMADSFFDTWAQVEGPVEIVRLPDAMPLLEETYRQVAGEHPDWAEFRAAMEKQERVVLRLTVDRAGPTVSG